MTIIKLRSSDNEIFNVDVAIVRCSNKIKTMMERLGTDHKEESVLHLAVNSAMLRKVLEWATFHKGDLPPPPPSQPKDDKDHLISPWDAEFLKLDHNTVFELLNVAHYLDIKGLVDVACRHVANIIKGKSTAEMREVFGIQNDFTPEEEEQMRKEYEWCLK